MVSNHSGGSSPFWPHQPDRGTWGMAIKLASNFFQISCDLKESLFVYDVWFTPELRSFSFPVQSAIEESVNSRLDTFRPFFRKGRLLYSRREVSLPSFEVEPVLCWPCSALAFTFNIDWYYTSSFPLYRIA